MATKYRLYDYARFGILALGGTLVRKNNRSAVYRCAVSGRYFFVKQRAIRVHSFDAAPNGNCAKSRPLSDAALLALGRVGKGALAIAESGEDLPPVEDIHNLWIELVREETKLARV